MLEIRRIKPEEIDTALSMILDWELSCNLGPKCNDVLSEPSLDQKTAGFCGNKNRGHKANKSDISDSVLSFKQLAQRENYDLMHQMVLAKQGHILYACIFIAQGSSAFVLTSGFYDGYHAPSVQTLQKLIKWAFDEGCSLLQVMLEPEDVIRLNLCLEAGFWRMTDLIYLHLPVLSVPLVSYAQPVLAIHNENTPGNRNVSKSESPQDNNVVCGEGAAICNEQLKWVNYSHCNHELFKDVISRSYKGSLDCPELENLRDMESVISSHKAAGDFDPHYWKLLFWQGKAVGVLLLSPLSDSRLMELTYMGLIPQARGHQLGRVLLQQACSCCVDYGSDTLILAQDCRNHYAYRLYTSFGFKVTFRRTVLICTSCSEQS